MGDRLSGRTAIVTGAGSSVGQAIARLFVAEGAQVMLADTREGALAETLRQFEDRPGRTAHFSCNLEERLAVNNLLAATQDAFGHIDVLVNAGRRSEPATFLELTVEEFDAAHAENLRSVFVLGQAVARKMIQQAEQDPDFRGAIVNVTSIAGRRTVPGLVAYSVACAGLDQLTRSMAVGLGRHRIRVNAVALGSLMSDAMRVALKERPALREEVVRVTPLGRLGEADEAARAAVYLASDEAGFITGQVLTVDGGRSLLDPLGSPVR